MKVVSILGGLGSQMQKYAFYLMLCNKSNQECYIDTTFFLQKNSWNGYELERVFNIHAPDLKDLLPRDAVERIIGKESYYLKEVINFLVCNNTTCYYFLGDRQVLNNYNAIHELIRLIKHKYLMLRLRNGKQSKYPSDCIYETQNSYFDEYLMKSDELFGDVKADVVKAFQFVPFDDEKNLRTSGIMNKGDSVAMHVRRTDHMAENGKLYERKYYFNSVRYLKSMCKRNLHFFIFSDDIEWCKNNLSELGLMHDEVTFVDWNSGVNSYKDMHLMTYCQHNILAISSFSWWGYYLSSWYEKIVCAPNGYWTEVGNHF